MLPRFDVRFLLVWLLCHFILFSVSSSMQHVRTWRESFPLPHHCFHHFCSNETLTVGETGMGYHSSACPDAYGPGGTG